MNRTSVATFFCQRVSIFLHCCYSPEGDPPCRTLFSPYFRPDDNDYQYHNAYGGRPDIRGVSTTTTPYPTSSRSGQLKNASAENLDWWVRSVLLPTAMLLIAICFILGVILVVKSYMLTSIKQNLATAIRRRRQTGHAPDNQYINPAEMRTSRPFSDRKSFPPPEVLLAARERASQIYTV
ncbi:unnamed protein product [Orchesella dallaii]|uniref:Uncharacterized protein n=1 Tax=Orchesella dallaii TaxID=48710 RepID=A0ABP1QAU3_9HEXA